MDVEMFILPFSFGGSDSLISFVGPIFASMKVLVDLFELSAYWELDWLCEFFLNLGEFD